MSEQKIDPGSLQIMERLGNLGGRQDALERHVFAMETRLGQELKDISKKVDESKTMFHSLETKVVSAIQEMKGRSVGSWKMLTFVVSAAASIGGLIVAVFNLFGD